VDISNKIIIWRIGKEGDRRSTDMNKKKAKKIEGEKIGERREGKREY